SRRRRPPPAHRPELALPAPRAVPRCPPRRGSHPSTLQLHRRGGPLHRLDLQRPPRHGPEEGQVTLRPRSTVVGLFGPRRPFAGGRLAAYRILNAPASAIHPATQREAGREGRADAPRSPVGSPPISTPYGWSED